jgi:aldose 1-epimerase
MLDPANFRTEIDGKPVGLYTLVNSRGMRVALTNYGAKIEQILVPDRDGNFGDVALGYDSIAAVRTGQLSMGSFIGRFANRIAGGKFVLDGKMYQLAINSGRNSLHGGEKGSRFVVFDARQIDASSVALRYTFKDGEENFPGSLAITVTYTVTEENALVISWHAVAGRRTIANFTDHTFFNLAGHGSGDILGHVLAINADRYTPVNTDLIPTGELTPVVGTPFDFREPTPIGDRISDGHQQIQIGGGYDHNFVLNKPRAGELSFAARVMEPRSGRVLELWTTQPGMQFFSGNNFDGKPPRDVGKGGAVYNYRGAFCIEAQHFPDSPNQPGFPSTVVEPGRPFTGEIVYKFSATPV